MANAVQMLDHRNRRFGADPLDQALAAARHDYVDILLQPDQFADRGPVGGFDHLYRLFRQAGRGQAFGDAGRDCPIGMYGFGTAA